MSWFCISLGSSGFAYFLVLNKNQYNTHGHVYYIITLYYLYYIIREDTHKKRVFLVVEPLRFYPPFTNGLVVRPLKKTFILCVSSLTYCNIFIQIKKMKEELIFLSLILVNFTRQTFPLRTLSRTRPLGRRWAPSCGGRSTSGDSSRLSSAQRARGNLPHCR